MIVPTVALIAPEVPDTVIVYVPGVVPVFPPPPPPPPPPPQPIVPAKMKRTSSPTIASQLRRLGNAKSKASASAVPPADGQSNFFIWFTALDAGVVVAVSVDVWAVVPLMLTEVGFRLQVGMSLIFVIDVLTLQLRVTVPLNPFVPTTLIVPVFPVVAPGVSVMEVVPLVPAAKLGSAVIVSAMLVVALNVPEVPVMVTVTGVNVTVAEVLAVRVST